MYGLIIKDQNCEWWVRRKDRGKSDIVITREEYSNINNNLIKTRVTQYEIDYILSKYCDCPYKVKIVARNLKRITFGEIDASKITGETVEGLVK